MRQLHTIHPVRFQRQSPAHTHFHGLCGCAAGADRTGDHPSVKTTFRGDQTPEAPFARARERRLGTEAIPFIVTGAANSNSRARTKEKLPTTRLTKLYSCSGAFSEPHGPASCMPSRKRRRYSLATWWTKLEPFPRGRACFEYASLFAAHTKRA